MIDMIDVLNKLEAEGLIKQAKKTGKHMMIHCPFHSDGKEKHPSCGVLLEDVVSDGKKVAAGHFNCFSCHTSKKLVDAVDYLLKEQNRGIDGVTWLRQNVPDYDPGFTDHFDYLLPKELVQELTNKYALDYMKGINNKKTTYVSEEELAKYRYTVPYMYERKLTDELIERYDVGYQADWIPPGRKKALPCITFPVRDMYGRTLFFCRRSIKGKLYNYPEGVTKPVYGIYELPKDCKSVVICESIINALTVTRYGLNAVALMGTGNQYQLKQLKRLGVTEFVLCLDGDEAGWKATAKLKKALKGTAIVWTVHVPEGKDVNDLSEQEFLEVYENRD